MIARTFKAKALVFAIFFIGIATGVLLSNFYTTRVVGAPGPPAPVDKEKQAQGAQRDINRFYDYLGLDAKQREQMHKIGEDTRQEFQALRKETQPRFQAIQEESRGKIRSVLTDDQRTKYDEFRRNMDERRKNRQRDGNRDGKDAKDGKNDRDGNTERQRPN